MIKYKKLMKVNEKNENLCKYKADWEKEKLNPKSEKTLHNIKKVILYVCIR